MTYQVRFSKTALKDLERLSPNIQVKVIAEIHKLSENPRHPGIKKLQDSDYYRARVNNYRIIYDIQDDIVMIMILKVRHRQEVYR